MQLVTRLLKGMLLLLVTLFPQCGSCYQSSRPTIHSPPKHQQHGSLLFNSNNDNVINIAIDSHDDIPLDTVLLEAADHYLHPFALRLTDFGDSKGGRGVQSLIDRPYNNYDNDDDGVFLKIPFEDTITSTGTLVRRIPDIDDNAFITSFQHLANDQEEELALQVLWRRIIGDPYVTEVLPKTHVAIWTLPQDLWNQIVDSQCLPRCYLELFQATRDRVRSFCQKTGQY
jgi:hypothetical protein